MKRQRRTAGFISDHGGAAALEFAIVGPMFVVMLLGICGYGGYFWISHQVQQVANDAARAAMGGLDSNERTSLANGSVTNQISGYSWLKASKATTTVTSTTDQITVRIAYDASDTPFWSMKGLIPMPSTTIARTATVRLGGY